MKMPGLRVFKFVSNTVHLKHIDSVLNVPRVICNSFFVAFFRAFPYSLKIFSAHILLLYKNINIVYKIQHIAVASVTKENTIIASLTIKRTRSAHSVMNIAGSMASKAAKNAVNSSDTVIISHGYNRAVPTRGHMYGHDFVEPVTATLLKCCKVFCGGFYAVDVDGHFISPSAWFSRPARRLPFGDLVFVLLNPSSGEHPTYIRIVDVWNVSVFCFKLFKRILDDLGHIFGDLHF
nr:MAG TPA: hypothetical protein [Caudoviricetes sp.]